MDLAEKLKFWLTAPNMMWPAPPAAWSVPEARQPGQLRTGRHLPCFTPDGRCVSLLKVLYSNVCSYDCSYCVNRRSNDRPRATLLPAGAGGADHWLLPPQPHRGVVPVQRGAGHAGPTMELMIEALRILREEFRFNGYIHAKTIPVRTRCWCSASGLADRLGQYRAAQRGQPEPAGPG